MEPIAQWIKVQLGPSTLDLLREEPRSGNAPSWYAVVRRLSPPSWTKDVRREFDAESPHCAVDNSVDVAAEVLSQVPPGDPRAWGPTGTTYWPVVEPNVQRTETREAGRRFLAIRGQHKQLTQLQDQS